MENARSEFTLDEKWERKGRDLFAPGSALPHIWTVIVYEAKDFVEPQSISALGILIAASVKYFQCGKHPQSSVSASF
jgi:hypothetical protein